MRISYSINQYPNVSHSSIRREILARERWGGVVQRSALRGWDAELVRQGENGWLFPTGAVDALAAAMADCLAQPAEVLQRMGEAGHQRVLNRLDIDTEPANLASLFRALA
jgi:hypothetical protein